MKAKLSALWESVSVSFWFIPGMLFLASIGLAQLMVYIDSAVPKLEPGLGPWFYEGSIDGARQFLSSLASAVITVAGVVFSITMVALTITSSQFGPRLLRNFMKDRTNQVILGAYIATYVYCLLVSNTLHTTGTSNETPRLAVSFGILLTIIDLGLLVYFLHHMAASIQATAIVENAYRDLLGSIDRMLPRKNRGMMLQEGRNPDDLQREALPPDAPRVPAHIDGYLKAINEEGLMKLAIRHDLVIQAFYRPGHFVFSRTDLAGYWPKRPFDFDLDKAVRDCFVVGVQRTPLQDVEFSVTQLVEVALRALSPGINDSFTAMNCLDRLAEAVSVVQARPFPSAGRYDPDGRLRLVMDVTGFDGIMDAAFLQIRQNAGTKVDVSIRLLEVLRRLAETAVTDEQRTAVRRHAEEAHRAVSRHVSEPNDQQDVDERLRSVIARLVPGDNDPAT